VANDHSQTGRPDVDALLTEHAPQRKRLNDAMAIVSAEGTVAQTRHADLLAERTAAHQRLMIAQQLLAEAQAAGDAIRIAAARTQVDMAHTPPSTEYRERPSLRQIRSCTPTSNSCTTWTPRCSVRQTPHRLPPTRSTDPARDRTGSHQKRSRERP
jgi:hypothetical protein